MQEGAKAIVPVRLGSDNAKLIRKMHLKLGANLPLNLFHRDYYYNHIGSEVCRRSKLAVYSLSQRAPSRVLHATRLGCTPNNPITIFRIQLLF